MQGIFYVLDAYKIEKTNPAKAVQSVNALNLTLNGANDYLRHAVELQDDETMPFIQDVTEARTILAYMVQVGLQRNKELFSLDAFNQFAVRAKGVKYEPVPNPQPMMHVATVPDTVPAPVVPDAVPSIAPSVIEPAIIVPQVIEPVAPVEVSGKKKRTRRIDPNSNLQRAKTLYLNALDKSRESILEAFTKELGIDSGTAMTYYYIARKG